MACAVSAESSPPIINYWLINLAVGLFPCVLLARKDFAPRHVGALRRFPHPAYGRRRQSPSRPPY